jgi:cytochrome c553
MRSTLEDLKLHARRFGGDMVMESAAHLTEDERRDLAKYIRRLGAEAREQRRQEIGERAARYRR